MLVKKDDTILDIKKRIIESHNDRLNAKCIADLAFGNLYISPDMSNDIKISTLLGRTDIGGSYILIKKKNK